MMVLMYVLLVVINVQHVRHRPLIVLLVQAGLPDLLHLAVHVLLSIMMMVLLLLVRPAIIPVLLVLMG